MGKLAVDISMELGGGPVEEARPTAQANGRELIRVVEAPAVTHLKYSVLGQS
jgi:hypothetical protein